MTEIQDRCFARVVALGSSEYGQFGSDFSKKMVQEETDRDSLDVFWYFQAFWASRGFLRDPQPSEAALNLGEVMPPGQGRDLGGGGELFLGSQIFSPNPELFEA